MVNKTEQVILQLREGFIEAMTFSFPFLSPPHFLLRVFLIARKSTAGTLPAHILFALSPLPALKLCRSSCQQALQGLPLLPRSLGSEVKTFLA